MRLGGNARSAAPTTQCWWPLLPSYWRAPTKPPHTWCIRAERRASLHYRLRPRPHWPAASKWGSLPHTRLLEWDAAGRATICAYSTAHALNRLCAGQKTCTTVFAAIGGTRPSARPSDLRSSLLHSAQLVAGAWHTDVYGGQALSPFPFPRPALSRPQPHLPTPPTMHSGGWAPPPSAQ